MPKPPPNFNNPQAHAEYMRAVASGLSDVLPGLGFCLLVFEFDKPGRVDYISNANREDMLTAIDEGTQRIRSGQDWQNPEPN